VTEVAAAIARAAEAELWRRGEAWRVLLDTGRQGSHGATRGGQRGWMERWLSHDEDAINGSGRQRGKSFGAYALLDMVPRQWPGAKVRYCALTIDTAQAILQSAMGNEASDFAGGYLASCPRNLRPYRDGYDWVFPGGGRLIVMGTDAQTFRRGRGFAQIAIDVRDEFCFYQNLDAVEAALNPGLMIPGVTGHPGRCLRISTPAESPGHPGKLLVDAAKAAGHFELETLYDNPRVDPEAIIRKECARLGYTREQLLASTYWRREYLGLWVTEESRAAVPAWTDEVAAECTREHPRPAHFDGYTGHDWGGYTGDPHAALFGFVDHAAGLLVIEDEYERRGGDAKQLCEDWKAIETRLWGERAWDGTLFGAGFFEQTTGWMPDYLRRSVAEDGPRQPFLRLGDNDSNLQGELMGHGYAVLSADKHEKHLWVDAFNVLVRQKRVIVNPRCRRFLEQLRTTLWTKNRSEWERTDKDHGDLIDCAVYISRHVAWHRDPSPPRLRQAFPWEQPGQHEQLAELEQAMSGRRRR